MVLYVVGRMGVVGIDHQADANSVNAQRESFKCRSECSSSSMTSVAKLKEYVSLKNQPFSIRVDV